MNAFFSNKKRSEIFTMGGVPFTPDLNLTRWLLEVPGIIDCTADPLYFVLTPSRFPELLPTTIREVSDYVLTAYFETRVSHARYKIYTMYWCVATRCLKPDLYREYLFGGYFTPSNSNPLTRAQSCPPYFRN